MDLTIVVPTYNRSLLLKNCLEFIQKQDQGIAIIIADSSIESEKLVNRKTVEHLGGNIRYLEFANDVNILDKIFQAIEQVTTSFACMCADDDLIVLESALKCTEFLIQNHDYVACHGHYLRYSITDSESILLEDWEYRGPSLTGDTPSKRAIELLSNYEALFYTVQKTTTLRMSLEAMTTSPYTMHMELANGLWLALAGKVKRIDGLHYLRQAGNAALHFRGEPYSYFARHFTTIMSDYNDMAEKLLARFKLAYPDVEEKEADLLQVLCFGFLIYLYRSINFIVLARQMIPNYSESDLSFLRQMRPPTFRPSIRFVLNEFTERGMRYLKTKVLQKMGPIAIRSNTTGHSVYISRVLNYGLTNQYREEIRRLF